MSHPAFLLANHVGELIGFVDSLSPTAYAVSPALTDDQIAFLEDLDARIYATANAAGVDIPYVEISDPNAKVFGSVQLQSYPTLGESLDIMPTPEWYRAMRSLKAAAEMCSGIPQKSDLDPPTLDDHLRDRIRERTEWAEHTAGNAEQGRPPTSAELHELRAGRWMARHYGKDTTHLSTADLNLVMELDRRAERAIVAVAVFFKVKSEPLLDVGAEPSVAWKELHAIAKLRCAELGIGDTPFAHEQDDEVSDSRSQPERPDDSEDGGECFPQEPTHSEDEDVGPGKGDPSVGITDALIPIEQDEEVSDASPKPQPDGSDVDSEPLNQESAPSEAVDPGKGEPVECDAENRLESLHKSMLDLDTSSDDWVSNKAAANLLGVGVKTLANRRSGNAKAECGADRYGVHDEYCYWRASGKCHPHYYLPLLIEHAGQLAKTFPKNSLKNLKNLP